jgi:hypothetical protein
MGRIFLAIALLATGCGSSSTAPPDAAPVCDFPLTFMEGTDGEPDALAVVGPARAAAGRVAAADLPVDPRGLAVYAPGDFVLANDRIAMIIEDVGPSDLYDPWGGRPVGVMAVDNGQLVRPGDFGEILMMTGRFSVVTTKVSVIADGSDGGPAIVRAAGIPAPTPFIENLAVVFGQRYDDVPTAIDYVLEPGKDTIDVYIRHRSQRPVDEEQAIILHGFMYTPRAPAWSAGVGFETEGERLPYMAFIDDDGVSWAYAAPGDTLDPGINASGFMSVFTGGFILKACGETERHYARLTVGGPGLDGLVEALARTDGSPLRAIAVQAIESTGRPVEGARVHATSQTLGYLTRCTTGVTGGCTVHVPAGEPVQLTLYEPGHVLVGPVEVAGDATAATLTTEPPITIQVDVTDLASGEPLPARVQVLPMGSSVIPSVPGSYGEPRITSGRARVLFESNGTVTTTVPAGTWEVVVSRGYEYEIERIPVDLAPGESVTLAAALEHAVDTSGVQCGDFHIHTIRSNDSDDDAPLKLASAVADGLEIPVRSDHEFVGSFQPLIEELGLERWAFGVGSIEMTSMEVWGHMGVVPLDADPTQVNAGAPLWETFPMPDRLDTPVTIMNPVDVFAAVRARPEQPTIIINHPRGRANYFDYVGYDRTTGLVDHPEWWDTDFTAVEVFNDSGWIANRDRTVADWLSFLDQGRHVFAVGSSDSHGITSSPVGYPRTCLVLGTDDPREVTPEAVRDAVAAGHSTISGGIYVDARIDSNGPGDTSTLGGDMRQVRVRVQAATWVDVDFLDVVVDGATVDTIAIGAPPDPGTPALRLDTYIDVPVGITNSYVLFAAYGDSPLDPVHPGRIPFGVTNPIFMVR